jgi:23S rRNA (uracil1939-C5)-methyltransferase
VGDALRRIGGLAVDDPQIEPATEPFGYRNMITLGSDPSGRRIGYHQFDRPERIFDLEQCEIAAPDLMQLWRAIRPHRHLLPMPLERLVLRRDRQGHRHLLAAGRRPEAWTRAQRLGSALAEQGIDATIWWQPPGGAVRVVGGSREVPAAPVFEQVNTEMGDRIREFTVGALDLVPGQVVWDLYAGAGQTTRLLVDRGGKVESIELDRHAVELAERSGPAPGVRRLVGRAEDLVTELAPPDAVVANPPRAGLALPVVEAIGRASPARLGYISCDPATLSRDLARLASVWPARLVIVRAFDLFPQTAHVETVAILERP